MYTTLKKTPLAALPLVGLLAAAPVTFAHDRGEHTAIHQERGDRQGDFHRRSPAWRKHHHFHKGFRGEHHARDWGPGRTGDGIAMAAPLMTPIPATPPPLGLGTEAAARITTGGSSSRGGLEKETVV